MRKLPTLNCGSECGIKIKSTMARVRVRAGVMLGLATAVTNPALAIHDYDGLAEYSALTSTV